MPVLPITALRLCPLNKTANFSAAGKLRLPVLALSADQGAVADMAAPLRAFAEDVRGGVIAFCGHFLPEEQPEAVARELAAFFSLG